MDFQKARFNMVEQQIRPWDVLDFDLLDAIESIPRENFVSPEQQNYAYADLSLRLPNGHMMAEPKIVARMIQALTPTKSERVLEIGTGSGYTAAILAKLAGQVVSCDKDETQLHRARETLSALGFDNITLQSADGLALNEDGSYDAVCISGSLPQLPENVLNYLNPNGGRLVAVIGQAPLQRCILVKRNGSQFQQTTLFETAIPGLNDQHTPQPNKFTF